MARPRRLPHKKKPDQVLAEGIIGTRRPGIPEGSKVQIARIVRTPSGLYFRVFNTPLWLGESELQCEFDANHIIDYVKIAAQNKEKLISDMNNVQFEQKQIPKGYKPRKDCGKPRHISTKRHVQSRGRTKAMDKKELKDAIAGLSTGDEVSVTFLSTMPTGADNTRYDGIREFTGQTVKFTLLETKKGRGKGGSQLMVLKTEDGKKVTTGTPHSEVYLNVTTAAGMVGLTSETEVPKFFEKNAGQASELKAVFKDLVGSTDTRVCVESSETEFNGTFTVTEAIQLRGRHGQVRLTLTGDDGQSTQLWSYRHSGVISKFEVVTDETSVDVSDETEALLEPAE